MDVSDGVCGGELRISRISEMVESSSKRLCSATGVPAEESVIHTDKSDKNTVLGWGVIGGWLRCVCGGCGIVILSCVNLEIWIINTIYEKIQKQLTNTDWITLVHTQ